ncbi:hypothetical protein CAPTEDRAFT_187523 [Capitella teleta]|uniref:Uncharacterized protein n=1 Tax=Capitella teleta TaxID=283909 RepID=R7TNI3_CAPTE|nr:hypothetical protein CAPTEDRAFT_187523 [Capitella teleta]|eukprot:ELT95194.1 hypothetical protein CAPTEDRAFT_187523 [Capitella teleta]
MNANEKKTSHPFDFLMKYRQKWSLETALESDTRHFQQLHRKSMTIKKEHGIRSMEEKRLKFAKTRMFVDEVMKDLSTRYRGVGKHENAILFFQTVFDGETDDDDVDHDVVVDDNNNEQRSIKIPSWQRELIEKIVLNCYRNLGLKNQPNDTFCKEMKILEEDFLDSDRNDLINEVQPLLPPPKETVRERLISTSSISSTSSSTSSSSSSSTCSS